ncbi:MAG: inositol monophosphatase family protein [Pseudomonadota bacterium]
MRKTSWESTIKAICLGAGRILLDYFHKPHTIEIKPGAGIVTEADKAAESYVLKQILRKFPKSSIITEEAGEYPGGRDLIWVIDPLDGTSNYAHGFPWFCVSIGLYEGDKALAGGIYHPVMKEFFFAERGRGSFLNGKKLQVSQCTRFSESLLGTGFYYSKKKQLAEEMKIFHRLNEKVLAVRRPGSAALDLACVAAGRFDGFWERGLSSWDVAAGILLVEEAGGKVTDYSGRKTNLFGSEIVASNRRIHKDLVKAIQG